MAITENELFVKQDKKLACSKQRETSRFWPGNSPCTNARICSYCSLAWLSLTKSILFCRIRMCFSFIISIAAKCSEVCGWGHDSLPAGITEKQCLQQNIEHWSTS